MSFAQLQMQGDASFISTCTASGKRKSQCFDELLKKMDASAQNTGLNVLRWVKGHDLSAAETQSFLNYWLHPSVLQMQKDAEKLQVTDDALIDNASEQRTQDNASENPSA
jgi:hypothetical protein